MSYKLTKEGWLGFCDDCKFPFKPYYIVVWGYGKDMPKDMTIKKFKKLWIDVDMQKVDEDIIAKCMGCRCVDVKRIKAEGKKYFIIDDVIIW